MTHACLPAAKVAEACRLASLDIERRKREILEENAARASRRSGVFNSALGDELDRCLAIESRLQALQCLAQNACGEVAVDLDDFSLISAYFLLAPAGAA
jgi:hypothetical protein